MERLYPVLKAAIIAGLAAGLVMGLFHFLLIEPVIDRAIALEEQAAHSNAAPLVSRSVQKGMLIVGSSLYGLLVGIIFALIFAIMKRYLPGRRSPVKAATLAGLLWWSVALLPFLKYPANPPGVGNQDTIYFRQSMQLGFIALSVLAVTVTGATYWWLSRRWRVSGLQWWWLGGISLGLYGFLVILLFTLMPANNDLILIPADLVRDFRILSLSGQVLFWATLGGTSALLLKRFAQQGVPEGTI